MDIGGYVGKVHSAGIDATLWSLQRKGAEIHAGRLTVCGNGQYRMEPMRLRAKTG